MTGVISADFEVRILSQGFTLLDLIIDLQQTRVGPLLTVFWVRLMKTNITETAYISQHDDETHSLDGWMISARQRSPLAGRYFSPFDAHALPLLLTALLASGCAV